RVGMSPIRANRACGDRGRTGIMVGSTASRAPAADCRLGAPAARTCARTALAVGAAVIAMLVLPVASQATEHEEPPTSFEPVLEAENFSITQQRQTIYDTPEYQAELAQQGAKNREEATT